ncbi:MULTISPECIES: CopG family ribbon-helix-helix protein [unclassified Variovorax]|uniref:CopG family ribbon-helix-helix protein n=1 Tax=unclassified Variovorax TaxID=663243 RepID=UPI001BD5FAE9|nr:MULTISPECIES: DUF1778 domain-containing protein [unclassified Variovorax]
MSTTTIRIEDDLKERIASAAERAGKTAHAFIVEAIAQTVERVEAEEALHAVAEKRWAKFLATEETVSWDEAKAYLGARAKGAKPARPAARRLDLPTKPG